jgi:hypothetical protein
MPWARVRFGDGGKLDLPREVPESEMGAVEKAWREAHCKIEWLSSIGGRLDYLLPQNTYVPPLTPPRRRRVRAYRYRE